MASGVDEIQATMNASVLDVPVTHCCEFLAQVSAVLVFDVFDDGIPAIVRQAMSSAPQH